MILIHNTGLWKFSLWGQLPPFIPGRTPPLCIFPKLGQFKKGHGEADLEHFMETFHCSPVLCGTGDTLGLQVSAGQHFDVTNLFPASFARCFSSATRPLEISFSKNYFLFLLPPTHSHSLLEFLLYLLANLILTRSFIGPSHFLAYWAG